MNKVARHFPVGSDGYEVSVRNGNVTVRCLFCDNLHVVIEDDILYLNQIIKAVYDHIDEQRTKP